MDMEQTTDLQTTTINRWWEIRYNEERYEPSTRDKNCYPDYLLVYGTAKMAKTVAYELSLSHPGCDYLYYVVGLDD